MIKTTRNKKIHPCLKVDHSIRKKDFLPEIIKNITYRRRLEKVENLQTFIKAKRRYNLSI